MTQHRLHNIFPHNSNISFIEQVESIGTMRVGLNPNQFAKTRRLLRNRNDRNRPHLSMFSIITGVLAMVGIIYIAVLLRISSLPSSESSSGATGPKNTSNAAKTPNPNPKGAVVVGEKTTKQQKPATCDFRKYPPRRYYGLKARPLPDFLRQEYIYGELPQSLRLPSHPLAETSKVCVDQSEWYHDDPSKELPFADGTNPSILKLPTDSSSSSWNTNFPDDAKYLMTICMTNSQCAWKDSPEESRDYKLSKQSKPSTVRTVMLILNEQLETLQEYTIYMVMDAKLGKKKFKNGELKTFALDDARLFTHRGELWVSYREGKLMGYENQVLSRVHFTVEGVR
jgi:hypothetical protein